MQDGTGGDGRRAGGYPLTTVVIPVHGHVDLTERCLDSLAAMDAVRPYEVLVVDDASPDDTATRLAARRDARVVVTPENLGFVGACNLGAEHAAGEVLVFLNNDTVVHPGWLDTLVGTLDDPTVGLAGSMLLSTDGLVQESGGIIWADGSGWNYGRGLAPEAPEVQTVRDVDYCSGAAIAVRADVFRRLGGFSQRYAPAYYEDTDLCFAVRESGLRVVVNPEAVVTHAEGASHGQDGEGGLKRFQAVNRHVFRHTWREVLPRHGDLDGAHSLWQARQRRPGGLVLVIDSHVPTPDRDSGSRRMDAVIDLLREEGASVHISPAEGLALEPYATGLRRRGVTVLPTHEDQHRFLREAGPAIDLVIVCRPGVSATWMDELYRWAPQALIAYDTIDLHALRMHRQAIVQDDPLLARQVALVWSKERAAMTAADVTLVVSETERSLLSRVMPDIDVRVLSNVHRPVVPSPSLQGRSSILFVGGYQHVPNVDAARWFVEEILPLVREQGSTVDLRLVGSHMPPEVAALAGPGVTAVGWAPDMAEEYARARVVVAPLRFGAGVKGKVAEALEYGVPVVGTSVALEAMGLQIGRDALRADDAAGFAAAVHSLLVDDAAWRAMAGAGQGVLLERFGPDVARRLLRDLLCEARNGARRQTALEETPEATRVAGT